MGKEGRRGDQGKKGTRERTLFLVQRLDESLVVRQVKVLEPAAHKIHRSLREERLETGDLLQAGVESLGGLLELRHGVEVELLGRVGEDGGDGALDYGGGRRGQYWAKADEDGRVYWSSWDPLQPGTRQVNRRAPRGKRERTHGS